MNSRKDIELLLVAVDLPSGIQVQVFKVNDQSLALNQLNLRPLSFGNELFSFHL